MDRIRIEVLKDGTIKSTTDAVSPENHQGAEAFLKMLASLTGGESKRAMRGDAPTHSHTHAAGQEHSHGDSSHSH